MAAACSHVFACSERDLIHTRSSVHHFSVTNALSACPCVNTSGHQPSMSFMNCLTIQAEAPGIRRRYQYGTLPCPAVDTPASGSQEVSISPAPPQEAAMDLELTQDDLETMVDMLSAATMDAAALAQRV